MCVCVSVLNMSVLLTEHECERRSAIDLRVCIAVDGLMYNDVYSFYPFQYVSIRMRGVARISILCHIFFFFFFHIRLNVLQYSNGVCD